MSSSAFLLFLAIVIGILTIVLILLLLSILSLVSKIEKEIVPKISNTLDNTNIFLKRATNKLDEIDLSAVSGILRIFGSAQKKIEPVIQGVILGLSVAQKILDLIRGCGSERSGEM